MAFLDFLKVGLGNKMRKFRFDRKPSTKKKQQDV